ncbi:MAG: hypothetical protein J7L55_04650 [Desulfurococcales archaeon]|nr:hypothetical protein [Desulfurococcales archaeon]
MASLIAAAMIQYGLDNANQGKLATLSSSEILKEFLQEAKQVYLNKSCPPEVFTCNHPNVDEFTANLIMNSTISENTIILNGKKYAYAVLQLYWKGKAVINPETVRVDNTTITKASRNETVTYTGGYPTTYIIKTHNETLKITYYYIGFMASSFSMIAHTTQLSNETYATSIFLGPNQYAWLVLTKNN